MPFPRQNIRNFSIIAHIDHGKSTLADRLLQATNAVTAREAKEQILDSMDIERERGITIKASAVTVMHHHTPGDKSDELESQAAGSSSEGSGGEGIKTHGSQLYMLNFIDTPGHVDFNYEVSRALKACEGALLIVDSTQGVQAQTIVNAYLAINENLTIIPVLNKIDLPASRPDEVAEEIESALGFDAMDCLLVSAKTGKGIPELLAAIIEQLPPPRESIIPHTRALIFDAVYDDYRGVVVYVRVMDGRLRTGDKIRMMGLGRNFIITDMGKYTPKPMKVTEINAGETGYFVATIKTLVDVRVGDTVTLDADPAPEPLAGYQAPRQMVYCDFYPATTGESKGPNFEEMREAVEKLSLNDASFTFQAVHSTALGFGFRCGFLGLLHMDIIQERLEREFGLELVQTAPTVSYLVTQRIKGGELEEIEVHNPADLPDMSRVEIIKEPICKVDIMIPNNYVGDVMKLCLERRGVYKMQQVISESRQMVSFEVPLAEIIYDFYDKLKGMTSGYGTMDYEVIEYRADNLVKVDILINAEPVEALSLLCHRDRAEYRGRILLKKLLKQIPKHQFEIPLQAAIGGKVVARETIKAFRKDVTSKCYGGDVSRKRKLLDKQKEGKKKMKSIGSVDIPQEAFMAVLDTDED